MGAIESRSSAAAAPQTAAADVKIASVAKYAVYGILCVFLSDISNDTPTRVPGGAYRLGGAPVRYAVAAGEGGSGRCCW